MRNDTRKRVMTVDRLTLVVESQDRLIKAKDAQIERLATCIQDFMLDVPELWGDHVTDGKITLAIPWGSIDDFERAIKEATNGS